MKVDLSLKIRCLLDSSLKGNCLFDDSLEIAVLSIGRNRLDNWAVKLSAELVNVDLRSFLCVYVALIECDYNGNAQLQKLSGEEQGPGKVGSVYDVNDSVRIFLADELRSDGFFGCER